MDRQFADRGLSAGLDVLERELADLWLSRRRIELEPAEEYAPSPSQAHAPP